MLIFFASILISCGRQNNNIESNENTFSQQNQVKNMDIKSQSDSQKLLMNEDSFWFLIDKSRNIAKNQYQSQTVILKAQLLKFDTKDIERFINRFTSLLALSYDWKLWGAAYVINGGCSDDCFDYFREYLIGKGRDKFYQTLNEPESCADWIKSEDDDNWEGLLTASMLAYKEKTGNDFSTTYRAKFELRGKPFDEETVNTQYPKLAKKFTNRHY